MTLVVQPGMLGSTYKGNLALRTVVLAHSRFWMPAPSRMVIGRSVPSGGTVLSDLGQD
jgi:hypothetical protein